MEMQLRAAIRDSVNLASRKPFFWGGVKGYQQLRGIAESLHQLASTTAQNEFFQRLILQVDRTLAQNQTLAANLEETHGWLCKVAICLRYPPSSYSETEWQKLTSQQVAHDMENSAQATSSRGQKQKDTLPVLSCPIQALERLWPGVVALL